MRLTRCWIEEKCYVALSSPENRPENNARLSVRVQPNASRSEIIQFTNGILQVRVAAPPVKGKANKELIAFLGQILGISKSSLSIIKGPTSRNKVITIDGLSYEEVKERLLPKPSSSGTASK